MSRPIAKSLAEVLMQDQQREGQIPGMDEIMLIGLPLPLVRTLTRLATERNMTLGSLLAACISSYLKEPGRTHTDEKPAHGVSSGVEVAAGDSMKGRGTGRAVRVVRSDHGSF